MMHVWVDLDAILAEAPAVANPPFPEIAPIGLRHPARPGCRSRTERAARRAGITEQEAFPQGRAQPRRVRAFGAT